MKLFILFVCLGFSGHALGQTTSTCVSDFSPLQPIIKSFNQTINSTLTQLKQLPFFNKTENDPNYNDNAWNQIMIDFAVSASNYSTVLRDIFYNLSASINDTKVANYPYGFSNVSALMASALTDGTFGNATGIPAYAIDILSNLTSNFTNSFANLTTLFAYGDSVSFIFQGTSTNGSANNVALKAMPAFAVAAYLKFLTNITANYTYLMGNITRDMVAAFNTYKINNGSVTNSMSAMTFMVSNLTKDLNTTYNYINGNHANLTKVINASLISFKASLPSPLDGSVFSTLNTNISALISSQVSALQAVLNTTLANITAAANASEISFLSFFPMQNRSAILGNFLISNKTMNCSINATNTAENLYKAIGQGAGFFNCTWPEKQAWSDIQTLVNTTNDYIYNDLNQYIAFLRTNCLSLKPVASDGVSYSAQNCLADSTSKYMPSEVSTITAMFANVVSSVTAVAQLAYTRFMTCMSYNNQSLVAQLMKTNTSYNTCVAPFLPAPA